MKILLRTTLVLLLIALLTGCCACRSYQKNNRRPLLGTEWQLIQLNGQSIIPEEGLFSITLLAEGNRLTGVGACNRLSGVYRDAGKGALTIGQLASTRMMCPQLEREHAFTKILETTTHYDMDGPLLMLICEGEIRAVFQAKK